MLFVMGFKQTVWFTDQYCDHCTWLAIWRWDSLTDANYEPKYNSIYL